MAERKLVGKKPLKKKFEMNPRQPARGHNILVEDWHKELEPGKNTKYVSFIMELNALPPVDTTNLAAMEARLQEYLALCVKYDMKVGNMACYFALGIDKNDVWKWGTGQKRSKEWGDFAQKVRKICGIYRENLMQDGQINPATGIFWQKNYDGLRDQQDVVLTPNNPLGPDTSPAELEKKYLEATFTDKD